MHRSFLAGVLLFFSSFAFATSSLTSMSVGPSTYFAGSNVDGTITVSVYHDPNEGLLTVNISTTSPLTGCTSIDIPAGASSGSCNTLQAGWVSQSTVATVTATLGTSTQSQSVTVNTNNPTLFVSTGTIANNEQGTGTITMQAAIRGAIYVGFTQSGGGVATWPASVYMAANTNSASFTYAGGPVQQPELETFTAQVYTPSNPVTIETVPTLDNGRCGDCEGNGGHPINFTNGDVWIQHQDYSIPGLGGGLQLIRTWNSLWQANNPGWIAGMFGRGWISNFEEELQVIDANDIRYWRADGNSWLFSWNTQTSSYYLASPTTEHASLVYSSVTNQYTITFKGGSQEIFSSGGLLLDILDRNGNQTAITRDGSNRVTQVTSPGGQSITFTYNAPLFNTLVSSVQDSTGTIATYTYNSNDLQQVAYPDGSAYNFTPDGNNNIQTVTDAQGKTIESHTYDGDYRGLTSARANGVDSVSAQYGSNLTTVMDSHNNTTTYNYAPTNARNYVTGLTGPGCASCGGRNTQSYILDPSGNRQQVTDALGNVTTYTYDSNSNPLTRTQTVNGSQLTWTYTYNSFGEVLTAQDPMGFVTTNTYDSKGNLLTTTTPSPDGGTTPGSTTTFTYDTKGELLTITDPLNNVTHIAYTTAGLIDNIQDAQGKVTKYTYDARGNRKTVIQDYGTGGLNLVTSYDYDSMNRLKKITYPTTPATYTQFNYDWRGRRSNVIEQNGLTTYYAYDDADRLISVTDAQSPTAGITQYAYDNENNLTSITDALGRVTCFQYNANDWLVETDFPLGGTCSTSTSKETYGYDSMGNLTDKIDRNGHEIDYSYDSIYRLTSKSWRNSSPAYTANYYYDNDSRLTSVTDPTGTYAFTFDNMGRLTEADTTYNFLSGTKSVKYTYDAASNRKTMIDPQGSNTSYVYDTLNRLQTLASPQGSFGFSYDSISRRTQLTRPNSVNTNYVYDAVSRLSSILHQKASTTLDGSIYTYDNAGNRLSNANQQTGVTSNYNYDNIYQLLKVVQGSNTTEQHAYDLVGNRDPNTNSYNAGNEQLTEGTVTHNYDSNGNQLTKTDSSGTTNYYWDYENRLTQVVLPGTGGTSTFQYDPFGRRIQQVSPTATFNYIYDGANLLEHLDQNGNVVNRFTYSLGIDEPIALLRNNNTYFYEQDGLGSVTSLSNSSGALSDKYVYDSYGKLLSSTEAVSNYLRYTGRESDSTGLYYYRARYYGNGGGRFISEDPTGFNSDLDLYRYVFGNTTSLSDPLGLYAGNANTWTYGEIGPWTWLPTAGYPPPPGLGNAKASIAAACARNGGGCQAIDPSGTSNPVVQAAWNNIVNATGTDQSGGGNFMCVGTQGCWFVHRCDKCSNGKQIRTSRPKPLSPSGTIAIGGHMIYFYNDPQQGWCNEQDRKTGCKCRN